VFQRLALEENLKSRTGCLPIYLNLLSNGWEERGHPDRRQRTEVDKGRLNVGNEKL
jgi:hypothetical protein